MSNGSSSSRLRPTATSRKSNVPVKRSATGKSPVRRSDVSNVRSGSRGTKKNNSSGKRTGGTLVSSLVKALIYIVFILIISGLLAVFAITSHCDELLERLLSPIFYTGWDLCFNLFEWVDDAVLCREVGN